PFVPGKEEAEEIKVEDLKFTAGGPPAFGRFYLTVDGYDRAFMFSNSSTPGQLQDLEKSPRIRLFAPRYAVPGPKAVARLEGDYPPEAQVRDKTTEPRPQPQKIRLDLDLDGKGKTFALLKELIGPREEHVYFDVGSPGGQIIFRNTTRDWAVEVD